MTIQELTQIGFEYAGFWQLSATNSIKFNLTSNQNSSKILYCFSSEDKVLYIGKSIRTLAKRMYGYQNPGKTQLTNIRVNNLIQNLLSKNQSLDIYVLNDNGDYKIGGFEINLAAGLEDTLISIGEPIWNISGNKIIKDHEE